MGLCGPLWTQRGHNGEPFFAFGVFAGLWGEILAPNPVGHIWTQPVLSREQHSFVFVRLGRRGEQVADERRRLLVVLGKGVGVEIHGECRRRVAESILDGLHIDAVGHELCGLGVSEFV